MASESDAELIEAYRAGNEAALGALVARHVGGAYAYALRMTGSPSDAEDVVQEAFVKAWRGLARYERAHASFKTWFMRILHNAAVDHLRRRRHLPLSLLAGNDEEVGIEERVADDAPLAEELAARADDAQAVEAAVATLAPPYREVLALHYGEELTFEEMAAVLETPANTLKSRHRRALMALKERLGSGRPLHPGGSTERI